LGERFLGKQTEILAEEKPDRGIDFRFIKMHSESERALHAQSEAIARIAYENDAHRRGLQLNQEQMEELESVALATAIATSEYHESHHQAGDYPYAATDNDNDDVQQCAAVAADEELARALESSERAAIQGDEDSKRTREQQQQDTEASELAVALDVSKEEAEASLASVAMEVFALRVKRARTQERNEGAWDCAHCTYTNRPYSQQCAVCESKPPLSVLTFASLARLRFGLEIEIIVPDGKRDGYTLDSIADDLTRLGGSSGPKVVFMGYSHETTIQDWKIVTDNSLSSEEGDLCFELVSPVLQGEGMAGLESFRAVMANVRKLGIATNASCGFHVHVDATSNTSTTNDDDDTNETHQQALSEMGTLDGLKRVAQCFCSLENAFDLLVARTKRANNNNEHAGSNRRANRNEFCRSNRLAFGSLSNRQRWEEIASAQSLRALVDMVNPDNDRYRKLNLTNICKATRPSTCEFRHHGGVEELQEAEAWVRLVVRFCERASQQGAASAACCLREDATPRDELRALFVLLDCEGLEQFFVVDRKLFLDRPLANDWECRSCSRVFANSRALSQHTAATGHG
jgi:hypothetical protein